ncbi:hypothetical protein ACFY9Q_09620 [Streptomyces sp. NPDC012389]
MEFCMVFAFGGLAVLMVLVGSAVCVDSALKAETDGNAGPGELQSL